MDLKNLFPIIQKLIAKDELKPAIDKLIPHVNGQPKITEELVLVQQALTAAEKAEAQDKITWQDFSRARQKISRRLLDIIERLKK